MEEIIIRVNSQSKSLLFDFLNKSHIEFEEIEDRLLSNLASTNPTPVPEEKHVQIERELRGE